MSNQDYLDCSLPTAKRPRCSKCLRYFDHPLKDGMCGECNYIVSGQEVIDKAHLDRIRKEEDERRRKMQDEGMAWMIR